MPLVPQRVCLPSSLLSAVVPQVSVADVVHYLQEKRGKKHDCRPSTSNRMRSVNQNVVYVKDGLVLLLLFWFGLPRPCKTTIAATVIIRQQATTAAQPEPHCVLGSCPASLLRVCPPSALALRWFWWNRGAKQRRHLQQHHADAPVFLQLC